jgi:hypothetical protein
VVHSGETATNRTLRADFEKPQKNCELRSKEPGRQRGWTRRAQEKGIKSEEGKKKRKNPSWGKGARGQANLQHERGNSKRRIQTRREKSARKIEGRGKRSVCG